jgi:hypothetical protein
MAVTLRSGIIIGLIGLALIGMGYTILSSDSDMVGFGTLLVLAGIVISLTSILGLSLILFKAVSGPNMTYKQNEEDLRKRVFFWVIMVVADFAGLFLLFKIGPSLGGLGILLILIGLLLILPLLTIMMGASAQLNAIRRILNTIISIGYKQDEAEEITMDVLRFLRAGGTSLTASGSGPLVPRWTEISGVELSNVINNVLNIRNRN